MHTPFSTLINNGDSNSHGGINIYFYTFNIENIVI